MFRHKFVRIWWLKHFSNKQPCRQIRVRGTSYLIFETHIRVRATSTTTEKKYNWEQLNCNLIAGIFAIAYDYVHVHVLKDEWWMMNIVSYYHTKLTNSITHASNILPKLKNISLFPSKILKKGLFLNVSLTTNGFRLARLGYSLVRS